MPNAAQWMERIFRLPEVVQRRGLIKFAQKVIKPVAPPKEEEKPVQEDEEEGQEKKKEVNPLDVLPPTKFDLYAFKTFFVNHADKKGAGINFFFENYDRKGYCIYFLHY